MMNDTSVGGELPRASFHDGRVTLFPGDCMEVLKALPDNSIDAVVTDPPYHLTSIVKRFGAENAAPCKVGQTGAFARASRGFMGKVWDGGDIAFTPELWAEVLRVLKPGGHMACFGGTRTYHRMACAIEDAGFEIRDQLAWTYGSGFPKSHDLAKSLTRRVDPSLLMEIKAWLAAKFEASPKSKAQINRECGFTASDYLATERGNDAGGRRTWHLLLPYGDKWAQLKSVLGFEDTYDTEIERLGRIAAQREQAVGSGRVFGDYAGTVTDYELTPEARQWQGWGTALKPSFEPLCLAQKPLNFGQNVETIGSSLVQLWSRLWLMLSAKDAAQLSTLSPSAYGADVFASAQWSVADASNTRAALCERMGMSRFESALTSSLNTVSLWSLTWAESLEQENTSTTETELSTTIDLRTLRFSALKITPEAIILAHKSGVWSSVSASPAERYLNAAVTRLSATLELSVAGNALRPEHTCSLDETARIKPNLSPICLARKPLSEGTVAANVLRWGTGALNIDACRVAVDPRADASQLRTMNRGQRVEDTAGQVWGLSKQTGDTPQVIRPEGRWPANLCHDGSPEVLAGFPETTVAASGPNRGAMGYHGADAGARQRFNGSSGSAARFFYHAKASAKDRAGSKHPTIKPIALMAWLVRMITPPGGTVLDPFAGTGTTAAAAFQEGAKCVLIEREEEYRTDIVRRVEALKIEEPKPVKAKRKARVTKPKAPEVEPSLFSMGLS